MTNSFHRGKETSTFYVGKFYWGNSHVFKKMTAVAWDRVCGAGSWSDQRTCVKPQGLISSIVQLNYFTQKLLSSGAGWKTPLALQSHLKSQAKKQRSRAHPCSTREHCCLSAGQFAEEQERRTGRAVISIHPVEPSKLFCYLQTSLEHLCLYPSQIIYWKNHASTENLLFPTSPQSYSSFFYPWAHPQLSSPR